MDCPDGDDSCEQFGTCHIVGSFLQRNLLGEGRCSTLRTVLCITAPPDVSSTKLDRFWIRVELGHYAVLRATNTLRAYNWQDGESE